MLKQHISFYFDVISPFAYFAWNAIARLKQADASLSLSVHPVLFAGLLNASGQLGPAEIPSKVRHGDYHC